MIDCLLSTFSLTICGENENIRSSDRAPSRALHSDAGGEENEQSGDLRFSNRAIGRRTVVAGALGVLASPFVSRIAYAAPKVIRISTPGPAEEWQSKGFVKFKEALEKPQCLAPSTCRSTTTARCSVRAPRSRRCSAEISKSAMISPQDITALIPEYSIFTTGYLMRDAAHLDAVYDGDIGAEYKARVAKDVGLQIVRSQYLGSSPRHPARSRRR